MPQKKKSEQKKLNAGYNMPLIYSDALARIQPIRTTSAIRP